MTTLTTVGYGDVTPVTPEGRLAAGGLMVMGITLFAAITITARSSRPKGRAVAGVAADRLRGTLPRSGRGPHQ